MSGIIVLAISPNRYIKDARLYLSSFIQFSGDQCEQDIKNNGGFPAFLNSRLRHRYILNDFCPERESF